MRIRGAILSLLGSLAAASGAGAADTGELRINGHINAAVAGQMQDALGHGAHVIRVTSGGGDPLPSLALARDIRREHATLIVDGLCAGACANFLFPAAGKRMVMPGALVIFSGTATASLALVPPEKAGTLDAGITPTALQEKSLISDAGLDQALLLEPLLRLGLSCYSLTSKNASGKSYVNYRSDYVGWVPSRAYLAHAGIKVGGFWPATAEKFQAAMNSAFPGGARGNVAFSGQDAPSRMPSLLARLKAVPQCDTGIPANRTP
ncbi:MAG: hypothetical protein V4527_01075 [Pseudomonadota bacterium]